MSLKLTFQITLKSDYHISAGHGLGAGVDSALLRDADGVPGIRGTTLTGLLRDGLWQLLQLPPMQKQEYHRCQDSGFLQEEVSERYCGQHSTIKHPDPCPICRLFGTPRTPKRWYISSARPVDMAQPSSESTQYDGHIVQRVRVSPRTRRAEPRKLFSQEDGDGRLTFEFTTTCPASDESALDEAALLTAAARNVRQLGHSRRRGQGECLFTLISAEGVEKNGTEAWQTLLLDRFAEKWLNGSPPPRTATGASFTVPAPSGNESPVRVRLIIRTDEPLLIAHRAEAGNQFETLLTITGQTVRGALAWRAAQQYDLESQGEVYTAFVNTFLRDQVQFPTLYFAPFDVGALSPTIPAPRDLFTCKVGGLDHGFWFATDGNMPSECPKCSHPLTAVGKFATLLEYDWSPSALFDHKPTRSNEMHIRIEPERGRVAEGDLFGYVALDAGQYFVGDLVCANVTAWERLQAIANIKPGQPITLQLGKASRRGYGQVTAWFECLQAGTDTWRQLPLEERVKVDADTLRMTLLTDTIITDTWGRYATGIDAVWLNGVIGRTVEVQAAAASVRVVDGFNAYLSLPRWRDMALVAGSTVLLKLSKPPDFNYLREVEQEGIGLRCNEGFGQVAFNHPVYTKCQGITDNIGLGEGMGLAGLYADSKRLFRQRWGKALDEQPWYKCRDARFTAVARWLHANRHTPLDELAGILTQLGEPNERFKEEVIQDYGDRSKENKLQAKRDGIKLVGDLLSKLSDEPEAFRPLGIERLAERVAGAVDPRTKEEAEE